MHARHRSRRRALLTGIGVSLLLCFTSSPAWSAPLQGSATGTSDPLEGIWHTGRLTQSDIVDAFVAAGGTEAAGEEFFAQLGGGTKHYAVITMEFAGGLFTETESADGGTPIEGYLAAYTETASSSIVLRNLDPSDHCVGTYSFDVSANTLTLHTMHQCSGNDGPYNTTLFATFPYTR